MGKRCKHEQARPCRCGIGHLGWDWCPDCKEHINPEGKIPT